MTWIIIVLLALILVALMNSNQSSSQAVTKVIKFSAIGALIFALWVGLVGLMVWINTLNNDSTWSFISALVIGVVYPPIVVFYNLKEVRSLRETDPKAAKQFVISLVRMNAFFIAFLTVLEVLKKERLEDVVYGLILAFSSVILILWSMLDPQNLRQIWLGPKEPENIDVALYAARRRAEEHESDLLDEEREGFGSKTDSEKDALEEARDQRGYETKANLELLEASLKAQHEAWGKRGSFSVRLIFWVALILFGAKLLHGSWHIAYDYVLTFFNS